VGNALARVASATRWSVTVSTRRRKSERCRRFIIQFNSPWANAV